MRLALPFVWVAVAVLTLAAVGALGDWLDGRHRQAAVAARCQYRAGGALPDPGCTPGATYRAVTQRSIGRTICVAGWTATVRPGLYESLKLKRAAMAAYGWTDFHTVESDHLIPLELGGAPADLRNIFPEPHHVAGAGVDDGSFAKDAVENHLKALVCQGKMRLAAARRIMRTDWRAAR